MATLKKGRKIIAKRLRKAGFSWGDSFKIAKIIYGTDPLNRLRIKDELAIKNLVIDSKNSHKVIRHYIEGDRSDLVDYLTEAGHGVIESIAEHCVHCGEPIGYYIILTKKPNKKELCKVYFTCTGLYLA